jgi:hypothetical protein
MKEKKFYEIVTRRRNGQGKRWLRTPSTFVGLKKNVCFLVFPDWNFLTFSLIFSHFTAQLQRIPMLLSSKLGRFFTFCHLLPNLTT